MDLCRIISLLSSSTDRQQNGGHCFDNFMPCPQVYSRTIIFTAALLPKTLLTFNLSGEITVFTFLLMCLLFKDMKLKKYVDLGSQIFLYKWYKQSSFYSLVQHGHTYKMAL